MQARDYRAKALRALRGKWIPMAALMLLASAAIVVLAGIFIFAAMGPLMVSAFQGLDRMVYGAETTSELVKIPASFFVVLIIGGAVTLAAASVLLVGLSDAARTLLRGGTPRPRQLFPARLLGKAVAMNFLRFGLVFVQSLALIVPGVIAALRYSMADYLLAAHPKLGPVEALRQSSRRMRGRKKELFLLAIGFIGCMIACMLPFIAVRLGAARLSFAALGLTLITFLLGFAGQIFVGAYQLVALTVFFCRADKPAKKRGSK